MFNNKFGNIKIDIKNSQMKLPDGTILDSNICSDICLAYERMCTAQYIMSDYGIKTYRRAWDLADDIRQQMDDYGMTESEAICEVI